MHHDIDYWTVTNRSREPPQIGTILLAYVENIRSFDKIDVSLRPIGFDKTVVVRNQILDALETIQSEMNMKADKANTEATVEATATASLPLGDRSSSEHIWSLFPGMSKIQYKSGISMLLREGAIIVHDYTMQLVPLSQRPIQAKTVKTKAYSGKAPKGWRVPSDDCVLFVANLPYECTDLQLAEQVEAVIGNGKIAKISLHGNTAAASTVYYEPEVDGDQQQQLLLSSSSRGNAVHNGNAHIEFFTAVDAEIAMKVLRNVIIINNRLLRFEPVNRESRSNSHAVTTATTTARLPNSLLSTVTSYASHAKVDKNSWTTVFVAGLPYKVIKTNKQ